MEVRNPESNRYLWNSQVKEGSRHGIMLLFNLTSGSLVRSCSECQHPIASPRLAAVILFAIMRVRLVARPTNASLRYSAWRIVVMITSSRVLNSVVRVRSHVVAVDPRGEECASVVRAALLATDVSGSREGLGAPLVRSSGEENPRPPGFAFVHNRGVLKFLDQRLFSSGRNIAA